MVNHTKNVRILVYPEEIYGAGCSGGTLATPQPVTQALINAANIPFQPMNYPKSDSNIPLKEYEREFIDGIGLAEGQMLEINKGYNFRDATFPCYNQSGTVDWLDVILESDTTGNSYGMHIEYDGKVISAYGCVPKKYEFKMNNNDTHDENIDMFYYDAAETGAVVSGVGQLNTGSVYWWKDGYVTISGVQVSGFKEMSLTIEKTYDEDLGKSGNPLIPYEKTKNVEVSVTYRGNTPDYKWDLLNETIGTESIIVTRNADMGNFNGTHMVVSSSDNSNTIPGEKGHFDTVITLKASKTSTFTT